LGTVYLVGAGPGDPGLITLKGIELIKKCDVIIYDRLVSSQLLEYVSENCIKIYVGKEAGHHSKEQGEINRIIVDSAGKYGKVVRLKGGDSFVFGRGGEEIEELQKHNIDYAVIPGVTSAIAVPECAGIPMTHRGLSQSFHVITGHTKATDNTLVDNFEVLAKLEGTLVFLMGLNNLNKITNELTENGKAITTPVAVISNGTMYNEKIVRGTLGNISDRVKEEQLVSPVIIVVGDTASLDFKQVKPSSFPDMKIGVVGTRAMREKLETGLHKHKAKVYTICDMQICETPFTSQLGEEIKNIDQYQWIIFTSQNAVKIFFDKMEENRTDRRNLGRVKFAVIGSGTKEALQTFGYYTDFVPSKYTTKALAEELSGKIDVSDKILIPRAVRGSKELTNIFKEKNINYKEILIYEVRGKLKEDVKYLSEMDYLIFASASGVSAFFEEIQEKCIEFPQNMKIACIGEVTAKEVRKYNREADVIANVNDTDGLIEEIRKNSGQQQINSKKQ